MKRASRFAAKRVKSVAVTGETIKYGGSEYLGDGIDLSIPLRFGGPQPNAYGVETARAAACEAGEIVGDTRRGGSCNFEQITMIPHCNGTHTECVGHITHERISVRECLKDAFARACLISVEPAKTGGGDLVITRESLVLAVGSARGVEALIVRTLPNGEDKMERQYGEGPLPAYFEKAAIEYVVSLGVRHLLADVPSVDRMFDEGRLLNHRIFWDVGEGEFETRAGTRREATITEMIYVPEAVKDGEYLLNLQIAPFELDASPSRPVIFAAAG